MSLPLVLAAVDAVAAAYLLVWALRREQRDKPAVAVVGALLAACAVVLLIAGLVPEPPAPPPAGPLPGAPV